MAKLATDNEWIQYWVQARHQARNLSKQLTQYFNTIAGNDPSKPKPDPINFTLPGTVPAEADPGIEFRTRAIARQIKGDQDYAVSDGELLGIVAPEASESDIANLTPEFTVKTLANFALEISFRKYGMDALKFQFRYKGGNWQSAGFLVASPGVISIVPSEPNTGAQIELRAIYILKNDEAGNYSDAKAAFIAP